MVSVDKVSVHFGSFELLNEVSFLINPRDRIGLVGKNGAGKSTLVKILAGKETATLGRISYPNHVTFGYLPQQMIFENGKTVFDEAERAFESVLKMKEEVENLTLQISERTDYESIGYIKLIDKLTELNHSIDIHGGANISANIEKTLLGLGFERSDFTRQTTEFSGGWRMRIELAKILLQSPDLLLLDEPTNHLDIESIQWLETFLSEYAGALVLISHDRQFLDTVTNRTIEISLSRINDYKVSYSKYVELRKERHEQQLAAYNNQQKMLAETEEFIERFRYKATKAVQVQSRIKQLEKIDRLEVEEMDNSSLSIKFPPAPRSGDIVYEAKNLNKAYGENLVLNDVDLVIERGEKVAFVGKNGTGKSTLVKVIMNETEYTGLSKIGYNVKIGYFAQNQAQMLDPNQTVFDTLDQVAVGEIRTKLRDILGAFLFGGEDIDKKVSVLSGGERARLALAKLLLEPYNLLVLDEPTNHLDMRSKEVLKNALLKFDGTLIVVSHDRYFLNGLTVRTLEFKNKELREHLGDIHDFLRRKKLDNLREIERQETDKNNSKSEKNSQSKLEYLDRKEWNKRIKRIERQIAESEENIERLENLIAQCEKELSQGKIVDNSFYESYEKYKSDLNKEMEVWEKAHEELENLNE